MRHAVPRLIVHAAILALPFCTAAPASAQSCEPAQTCGDVNDSGELTATDALLVLKGSVGQEVTLTCECTGGTGSCETCETDLAQCTQDLDTCNAALEACDTPPSCGNGQIELGEHCDTGALDGYTCAKLGHAGGTLACTDTCDFDVSGCDECGGLFQFDVCWYLGELDEDCNEVCTSHGDVYDAGTSTVAGSSGTNANCEGLLDGLNAPGEGLDNDGAGCGEGFGCAVASSNFRARCSTPPTDAISASAVVRRVCGCH